jgi:hypothetical protein
MFNKMIQINLINKLILKAIKMKLILHQNVLIIN